MFKALGDNTRYAIYLELARAASPRSTVEVETSVERLLARDDIDAVAIAQEFSWLNLVPVALVVVWAMVASVERLLLFIVFATPLSINLEELDLGGIGISLPTEPLMVGVTLLFLIKLALERNVLDPGVLRHPVTAVIVAQMLWMALCIVPSEEAFAQGLRAGLSQAQLRLCGLPIRAGFGRLQLPRAELRSKLELADRPTALLVGGGEGMGQMSPVARTVAAELARDSQRADWPMGQLVVICGRNESLEEELKSYPWPVPTVVKGYVSDIWTWMAASDLVVTKAGPGTIAEAAISGLPMILSDAIPYQESPNIGFVVNHQAGVFEPDPEGIAALLARWFSPGDTTLRTLAEQWHSLGLRTCLRMVPEPGQTYPPVPGLEVLAHSIDYPSNIDSINRARCLLEITQANQTGDKAAHYCAHNAQDQFS